MEYLSNGDLQKHLGSPRPESEAQSIVFQVLEGLNFMHQNGFAHRDLKPANILVVKQPDWWVKIADFGISKRATEELTALRTLTGTPAFAAPEVLGFTQADSYTNTVDIWSLGVIAFLILTGETMFIDLRRIGQYVTGTLTFPSEVLLANKVSEKGCKFVKLLMAVKAEDRPGAEESLQSPWFAGIAELVACQTQRMIDASQPLPETSSSYSEAEASASWSTHDQPLSYMPYRSSETLARKADCQSSVILTTQNQSSGVKSHGKERMFSPVSAIVEQSSKARTQAYQPLPIILRGHSKGVWPVAFSPDSKQIASASLDGTVRLWNSSTGAAGAILEGHSDRVWAVAFSPDSKQIASASADKTVRLWNSTTGAAGAVLKGHTSGVFTVAFSPDSKQIASASADKTVRLWDSTTGAAGAILLGHSKEVWAVAFSPDGKQIASASSDKTVRLWDSTIASTEASPKDSTVVRYLKKVFR